MTDSKCTALTLSVWCREHADSAAQAAVLASNECQTWLRVEYKKTAALSTAAAAELAATTVGTGAEE
jgi:hypothetical protein